ncbi:MAG: hypothetical protein DYH05_04110 [Acidobacteria bacterium ACB1]|nr:hypothetical protein [Pyrinomonadaceae bacterium]MCE7961664.1 hypothetical protein [Acidobacteria bacterium ACB1]RIJ91391.1 MAG: hypothetical protein DCC44_09435 [Acidobacteriota bacterium]
MSAKVSENLVLRFAKSAVLTLLSASVLLAFSCSTAESKDAAPNSSASNTNVAAEKPGAPRGASIEIETGGPADTVRTFYKLLREKKFRDALFLTNLRPAIESLNDTELKDFSLDFEAIAGAIPTEIEINGEIVSGDNATVTANLPDPDDDSRNKLQKIELKRIDGVWIIQTADAQTEERIRKEGKNYFYNLRIETHEEEAKIMLERIAKAQVAYSMSHDNTVTDINGLITAGLLPPDITSSASTGYNYAMTVSENKRRYTATATPAEYGRSGKRSFILEIDKGGLPHVRGADNKGRPLESNTDKP